MSNYNYLNFIDVGVSINHVEGYSRITSVTVIFRGSRIGVNITRGLNENSFLAVSPILPPELMVLMLKQTHIIKFIRNM